MFQKVHKIQNSSLRSNGTENYEVKRHAVFEVFELETSFKRVTTRDWIVMLWDMEPYVIILNIVQVWEHVMLTTNPS